MEGNKVFDRKKSVDVVIYLLIIIILILGLYTLTLKLIEEKNYNDSFKDGLILGVGVNTIDMQYQIGRLSRKDYVEFTRAYDTFYSDHSEENFKKLANIILEHATIEGLKYGKSVKGLMDGLFVGDTNASVETIYRSKDMSDELYEEYKSTYKKIIDNPSHERIEKYTDYMANLHERIISEMAE